MRNQPPANRRLQQAGDGRAVPAQIEQQRAHVGRGLHQHDEECLRVKHRNDREPAAELEDRGVELAAASGRAEWSSAATLSASTPLATRESMGSPSRPTTNTASTPLERLSASTTSRMVAIRAANVGLCYGEVKQRLWVDPLRRWSVSSSALSCVT